MPQIKINGDVNLIGWEGKRISVWEKFETQDGRTFSRLWNCWFDISQADRLQEQDWVEISGELSTKIGTYTPKGATEEKTVVEHHVQNAVLVSVVTKAAQEGNAAHYDSGSLSLEDAPF